MRSLRLRKETLAELSADELVGVAGASLVEIRQLPTREQCAYSLQVVCLPSLLRLCPASMAGCQ